MFYSPREWFEVAKVRPDVRAAVLATGTEWEREFPGERLAVATDGGYRGDGVQDRIYADSLREGFRAAPPGKSPHEIGAAIDVKVVGLPQVPERDVKDRRYIRLAEIAKRHGLRSGLYFKTGRPDPYHLEADETRETMLAKWAALTKERLWRGCIIVAGVAAAVIAGRIILRKKHV